MNMTNRRWLVCALLFLATTINYIDRHILSLLKPLLDRELGWSNAEFGAVNSAFQLAYGTSVFFFGWLIDRYGSKIGYAVSIIGWSLAAIGHAFVASVGGFIAARIALGTGEGGNFPAAVKATAEWFPKKERALATGIFNSGANVGSIAAAALVPPVAYSLGWQWVFVLAGLAGFVWLAFWWGLYQLPEKTKNISPQEVAYIQADADETNADGPAPTWGQVLRHRQAWSFVVAKFITDPVWWFYLIWLPDFFRKTRGLDIKNSWPLLVGIYGLITVGSIAGGWLTGCLLYTSPSPRD